MFALGVGVLLMSFVSAQEPTQYPKAKRDDRVETHHGVAVPDPYRWLEDDVRKSDAVKSWVDAQNAITNKYLDALPDRDAIKKRLTQLWDYEKYSAPAKVGGKYF